MLYAVFFPVQLTTSRIGTVDPSSAIWDGHTMPSFKFLCPLAVLNKYYPGTYLLQSLMVVTAVGTLCMMSDNLQFTNNTWD